MIKISALESALIAQMDAWGGHGMAVSLDIWERGVEYYTHGVECKRTYLKCYIF
jgi:hypothetical protein